MKSKGLSDSSMCRDLWRQLILIGLIVSIAGCVSFSTLRYVPDNAENVPNVKVEWSSGELICESSEFVDRYLIAADAKGRVLAVWTTSQSTGSGEHDFWSSLRDKGVWTAAGCFHQVDSCRADLCDLCVDNDGNFHVLYSHRESAKHGGPTEYWVRTFVGGHGQPPEKADKGCAGVFKGEGAISAGSPNILHAVFVGRYPAEMNGYGVFHGEFPCKLFYVRRESGHWSPRVEINELGRYYTLSPSLAVDSTGTLHLAYERLNFGVMNRYSEASYQSFQDGSWSRPVRFGRSKLSFEPVEIVLDRKGRPHIVWIASTNSVQDSHICHVYKANGKWSPVELIGAGFRPHVVADKFGNVHVGWLGKHSALFYRCWSNGHWSKTVVIGTASAGPLAVGPGDTLHLIWAEDGNRTLRYMRGVVKPGK